MGDLLTSLLAHSHKKLYHRGKCLCYFSYPVSLTTVKLRLREKQLNVTHTIPQSCRACSRSENLPALKPGLHVRRKHKHKHKHKHKKTPCKPVRRKHKRLVLALVLMLASSRFTRTTQRRKHKHKHKRMKRFPFYCACAYACVVRVNRDHASISISTTEHELSAEYLLGVRHLDFKIVATNF